MAYYPDCGHEYCNCPSYPGVTKAWKLEGEVSDLQKKNDELRAHLINAKKSGDKADRLERRANDLEERISACRRVFSQLRLILNDSESDSDSKLKLIDLAIKTFTV